MAWSEPEKRILIEWVVQTTRECRLLEMEIENV